jgi:hypothetical protein
LNSALKGMIGVLRAYVATASSANDRVRAIALNTAFFSGGIAVGPGLQVAFSPIGYPGFHTCTDIFKQQKIYEGVSFFNNVLRFDMYTTPAFAAAVCTCIIAILMVTMFKEKYAGIVTEATRKGKFLCL